MENNHEYEYLKNRVNELEEWLRDLSVWLHDQNMISQFNPYGSAGASMAVAVLRTSLIQRFPEFYVEVEK